METKESKKYVEVNVEPTFYKISSMEAKDLYKVLCNELSFEKMITLYKLLNHKIAFMDDAPELKRCCELGVREGD